MAKVYESKAPNRLITASGGVRIKFQKTTAGYGVLASDDPMLARSTRLQPEEIEAIIERAEDFGTEIWVQQDRIERESNTSFGKIHANLMALGEAALRKKIAEAGLSAPIKATLDELATLALEAMAKGRKAKPSIETEPEPAAPAKIGKRGDAGKREET